MPGPFFTSNDLEFSRLEGLYIKELSPPAQIRGRFLGVVGIVGETVKGPVDKVVEITSEARFREVFGGRDQTADGSGGAVVNKVWLSMLNKPFGKVCVVRAAASAAVAASHQFSNAVPTAILKVEAANVGTWGNNLTIDIQAATDGNSNHFNLVAHYLGNSVTYKNLDVSGSNDNTLSVVGSDDGNWIKLTKLASGRPVNATGTALTSGADGSIADSDFTATGRGINLLASYPGLGTVFIAERSSTALKAATLTLAAAASDRLFLIAADDETVDVTDAATDVGTPYRDQRLIYCYNHAYTLDPATATEVLTFPTSWMASILSQTDVDIHPGEEDTKQFTKGITRLYNTTLTREDYITLHDAGICALEKNEGFNFVSGVVTDRTDGKTEITRRRSADFLQLSVADQLKFSVKKKNTSSRRAANAAMITTFLKDLKKAERIVEDFAVDTEKLNTDSQRAAGIEKILMRVKLLGHMLHLVLETEIGTSVNISEQ